MATGLNGVIQHLRRAMLLQDGAGLTDGQLLEDYVRRRDEAALAALVQRHAPMVWGVCRRVLGNHHDVEDAFQATFLVLVRRAASLAAPELLANWLYGVAHQTAMKARATALKRKVRERQATEMPEPAVAQQDLWNDLQPLLDQELSRLPGIYRVVIVLCDLEGKTRKEAARHLGLPEGTVGSRLARARGLLAKRLTERGVTLSGGALAAVLAQNAASAGVPSLVVANAIQAASLFAAGQVAATGPVSVKVAALAEGVLRAMMMSKLKAVLVVVLVLGFIGTGATVFSFRTAAAQSDRPPIAAQRADSIEGTWEIVSAVYDGKPSTLAGKRTWTITKTHIEYDDTRKDAYVLDSQANPQQIHFTQIRPGENADGGKFIGIYEVKGDTLKICVAFSDARPKAFESTVGSRQNLHTLKRVIELEIKAAERVKTPPQDLGKIQPPGGVPLPLGAPGTPITVDFGRKATKRLEAAEKDLYKWLLELERIMDQKLDGGLAKQACRTYFVTRVSVAFDDLKWNAKTADSLFKRAQTMPASEAKVWKEAFEALLKKEIGQTDTTNYAGGPAYAVPLVLIPVEALHEGQKYSAERGKKYLARLKQLTADDVSLWKDEVDEFGGTKLDAAVNIILLDDYFDKEKFQRDNFKAAIGARKK